MYMYIYIYICFFIFSSINRSPGSRVALPKNTKRRPAPPPAPLCLAPRLQRVRLSPPCSPQSGVPRPLHLLTPSRAPSKITTFEQNNVEN